MAKRMVWFAVEARNPCCGLREAKVAGGTSEGDPLRLGDSVLLHPGKTRHPCRHDSWGIRGST